MNHLPIMPVMIPLIAGALLFLIGGRGGGLDRVIGVTATVALLPVALLLLQVAGTGQVMVYYDGNWSAPFGIVLVVDRLSALMLCLNALLALASLLYAITGDDRLGPRFHLLFQMQLLGINGAFLTGDLFNLFVFFEILLIASYALQFHGGGKVRVRATLHLVVLNLIGSSVFLIGIGAIYAATGTLNLADLAVKVAAAGTGQAGLLKTGGILLLLVFALKAALVPLGFWLPPAYSVACAPVAALFAIMTKVGIYAILRLQGLVFGPEAGPAASLFTPWLLPLGLITVVVATFGILASNELRRLLAHLVVLSAGTLTLTLGLDSPSAVASALFYLLNSTLVGGGLFLLADLIARDRGDAGTSFVTSQTVSSPLLLGSLFFVGAIGVAGLPPLAGFPAKLYLLQTAFLHPAGNWVFSVVLISGLLVVVALSRAGSAIFWRTGKAQKPATGIASLQSAATASLLLGSAALMIGAGVTTGYTQATAVQLADHTGYVEAVMENRGVVVLPAGQGGS
ncbi:MAG: monovalent cation/H+ antiporter subunit D [Gammaproteobacteria bacterium]|nr:monovalent cation/H+ antiporter subunit D [Gammaproteobacteria bacterium]